MNKSLIALKPFLESEIPSMTLIDFPHTYIITKTPIPLFSGHEVFMIHIADIWEYTDMYSNSMDLTFAGLYISSTRTLWYDHNFALSQITNPEAEGLQTNSIIDMLDYLKQEARKLILTRLETNMPFPITPKTKTPHYSMASWKQNGMCEDVRKGFMERKQPELQCGLTAIPAKYKHWNTLIAAILNPAPIIQQIADEYCEEFAAYLNMAMEQLPLVRAAIADLEADLSHPMQLRRKLAECVDVDAMKTVTLTLKRDGHTIMGKVEAAAIWGLRNSYPLYSSHLDPKARSEWKALFKWEDINPEDIVSITYGKKTLYMKEEK